jgi:Zn-dependent oligopeptidase
MLLKINTKITYAISLMLLMSACSFVGSWAFNKLDGYLNDYFFTFADFTETQEEEIKIITRDFKYWLIKQQLPEVKLILNKVESLNQTSTEAEINAIYQESFVILKSISSYFDSQLIIFSSTLDKKQINEIENRFLELRKERKERNSERENVTYEKKVQEDYIAGFKRVGVKLSKKQKDILSTSTQGIGSNEEEWSQLREQWTAKMIKILRTNQQNGFDEELKDHLSSLFDLGTPDFKEKNKRNQTIGIRTITKIANSMDEGQFNKMKKNIRIYRRSIDKILRNQNQEGPE